MTSGHALASVSPAGGTGAEEFDAEPVQPAKVIIKANAEAALK
jgi:hypothetical protein